ncbi:uncharacterized protein AMSG_00819 [Thecamonas trahens ATCC 50062]|uniref:Uncharacterized protein n=1 Tax=Thecamonas trahens ATCC 50062 TaxID=461836 RepID=A0A0L0DED4_THETB|nr:hypothetical protein AMSG_00819 [Thecamonas trahens ATCC 50062]KNC50659.1 hypothetical protein AMSG_00819 [Thecamonas trahens ATCC 50062]|eukprot:XP_013762539.1 hypothetical protein AMSG_00819 [Thecamonas trahens ATCC 50062]
MAAARYDHLTKAAMMIGQCVGVLVLVCMLGMALSAVVDPVYTGHSSCNIKVINNGPSGCTMPAHIGEDIYEMAKTHQLVIEGRVSEVSLVNTTGNVAGLSLSTTLWQPIGKGSAIGVWNEDTPLANISSTAVYSGAYALQLDTPIDDGKRLTWSVNGGLSSSDKSAVWSTHLSLRLEIVVGFSSVCNGSDCHNCVSDPSICRFCPASESRSRGCWPTSFSHTCFDSIAQCDAPPPPAPSPSPSGLSTSKMAIAVAGGVGGLAVIAAIFFFVWRARASKTGSAEGSALLKP